MRPTLHLTITTPAAVLVDSVLERVFDCRLRVGALPPAGAPFFLPQSASV